MGIYESLIKVSNTANHLYGCTADEAIDSGLIYGKIHPDDIEEFIRVKKKH
jgi:hypothetical protein